MVQHCDLFINHKGANGFLHHAFERYYGEEPIPLSQGAKSEE